MWAALLPSSQCPAHLQQRRQPLVEPLHVQRACREAWQSRAHHGMQSAGKL